MRENRTGSSRRLQSHIPRRALDRPHRRFNGRGVQVGELRAGYFFNLLAGHAAHAVPIRLGRPFFHPGRLLQEVGSGRSLGDEGKRPIGVDSDNDRYRHVAGVGRLGVERLTELHYVDAMLTERGADRGRGIGLPCRDLQLYVRGYLLCHLRVFASQLALKLSPFFTLATNARSRFRLNRQISHYTECRPNVQ